MKHHRTARIAAVALGLALSGLAVAAPRDFQGLAVEVRGEGRPVLMIPGLNSPASVWDDTCAALQADGVACHLVQLPGFAGHAALTDVTDEDGFLAPMRDRLLAYVAHAGLDKPAVAGHSLGGVLALMMAIESPASVGPLLIVDSLPFFPAAMNAQATAQTMRPMAEAMRTGMRAQSDEDYAVQARAQAGMGMSSDPARTSRIQDWTGASDRETTTRAMFDMFSTDLRPQLGQVRSPVLVLGAWAAYAPMGSTLDSTRGIFEAQYATLPGVRIEMSEAGYHFLMFDDLDWLLGHARGHLLP
ncbi:MAG: alpha/beta hydrolase [Xanthomonadales bacterium]|nr:alpha/beta hydrolase [Xanthomonadales bacterium]